MASLVKLFNVWEIQMLVLLSFMLQVFLFFAGGLRRHTHRVFLRLLIWIAYLGADMVAAYALGLISRQEYGGGGDAGTHHHQLAVLWAPFLLIHLGGQDTITGFSLEDNNLWRRHLLNLAVQVTLTLYIFCKSASGTNGTNAKLLAPSILVFITGTIKYGERTWALRSGVLRTLKKSSVPGKYEAAKFPPESHPLGDEEVHSFAWFQGRRERHGNKLRKQLAGRDEASILRVALVCIHSAVSFMWEDDSYSPAMPVIWDGQQHGQLLPKVLKILEIELSLVYDYIYTKAVVFQTQGGIILRCISQASFVASFLLFATTVAGSSKQQREYYSSIDTATTYALFVGGLSLEACALFTTVSSVWAWAWLEDRRRHCSFLAPIIVWWQRKRVLWSCSMGQYNLQDHMAKYDQRKSRPWKQRVITRIRKVVDKTCGPELHFWISKHLDIKFVKVDKGIMRCIFEMVAQHAADQKGTQPQHWPNLGAVLERLLNMRDPGRSLIAWQCIALLHTYTEAQLRMYPRPGDSTGVTVRKLSNYMAYLLATQPGMLPVCKDADSRGGIAGYFARAAAKMGNDETDDRDNGGDPFPRVATELLSLSGVQAPSECTKEQLLETRQAWIRLLVYMAGRSRPEMHAAQLARGGELLTFVWLLMAFKGLGDAVLNPVRLSDLTGDPILSSCNAPLFRLPQLQQQQEQQAGPDVEEGRQ